MVATNITAADITPAADSPAAALRLYDELTLLRSAPASAWRDCALRLRAAGATAPAVFVSRYTSRAVDCLARAAWLDAQPAPNRILGVDLIKLAVAFAASEAL